MSGPTFNQLYNALGNAVGVGGDDEIDLVQDDDGNFTIVKAGSQVDAELSAEEMDVESVTVGVDEPDKTEVPV